MTKAINGGKLSVRRELSKDEKSLVSKVRKSGLFDESWYMATYPDVALSQMQPIEHYLKYGASIGRDPNPDFSTEFYLATHPVIRNRGENPLLAHLKDPKASEKNTQVRSVLWAAMEDGLKGGGFARALHLARRFITPEFEYTLSTINANQELLTGNKAGWVTHFNSYLGRFDLAPLAVQGAGPLLDRLSAPYCKKRAEGPLVTVIMAAYNSQLTVFSAAKSILQQTWANLELIIVDDASTDNTWREIQRLAAADSRVKALRNKKNVGPYASKNQALMQANGAWITGHDADDWSHPQRIENHMNYVLSREGTVKASVGKMVRMKPDGLIGVMRQSDFCEDGVARTCSISCLYEKKLLDDVLGFWDSARAGADSEMISRAENALGDGFQRINQISMLCLDVETSLTNDQIIGVKKEGKIYHPRTKYRENWTNFHKSPQIKDNLYCDFPKVSHKYYIPKEISVNANSVRTNLGLPTEEEEGSRLKNVIFVAADLSRIGGIPNRIKKVIRHSYGRDVEYLAISGKHSEHLSMEGCYSAQGNLVEIENALKNLSAEDTVVILNNNALTTLPKDISESLSGFPMIYLFAGQMSFFIQDSNVLLNEQYVNNLRVSKIISLSNGDIDFQRQLGIFNQVKGAIPVDIRHTYTYDTDKNVALGYVGRIDFHAKDCLKLLDVAEACQKRALPALKIFTTDSNNSPDLRVFLGEIEKRNLGRHIDLVLNCSDKDKIYRDISFLILPSKKEAFGNVVLEAFSYGVPVIAASYAPGPKDVISHKENGYLLDDFIGEDVVSYAINTSIEDRMFMSRSAFSKHFEFGIEEHVQFLEKTCEDVLKDYKGKNLYPVFPKLSAIEGMRNKNG